MIDYIEITDFSAPELDIYARLTEAQLLNRFEPKKGMFIAESPKVISRALDAGCEPVSLLVERNHVNEEAREAIERCGDIPVYTASLEVLTQLTGFQLTRGMLCAMRRPPLPAVEEVLQGARRIAIFGVGASGAIASDLQHKLQRLDLNAQAYVDSHLQALSAAYLTEEDVVLAISHSGSSRVVVDNVRIAKENGAKVITLTNIGRSPLSKLADISLFTASQETKFRILAISSRIAELTILDCIYTYIALHTDGANSMKVEKAMENLKY